MDSAAAAFALDKPALGPGPPPPPALGPGDCAQARKNFTVSHLLDLEEVAAAGRLAARPAGAEAREGAAREPSGGSSGSDAAPQDGECGAGGAAGGSWERDAGSRARGAGAGGPRPGALGCGAPRDRLPSGHTQAVLVMERAEVTRAPRRPGRGWPLARATSGRWNCAPGSGVGLGSLCAQPQSSPRGLTRKPPGK